MRNDIEIYVWLLFLFIELMDIFVEVRTIQYRRPKTIHAVELVKNTFKFFITITKSKINLS